MMTGRERTTLAEYLARLDEAVDVCDGLRALANTDAEQVTVAARAPAGSSAPPSAAVARAIRAVRPCMAWEDDGSAGRTRRTPRRRIG